jgi:hypothetical protein
MSRGIKIFIAACGELAIDKERDGAPPAAGVQLNASRKRVGRHIRVVPELHGQNVTCVMPWRRRRQCRCAQWGPRDRKALEHLKVLPVGV